MKSIFTFFRLLFYFSLTVCLYSQNNSPGNKDNPSLLLNSPASIWDVQLNINVTGSGAVKDGEYFYVTQIGSSLIRSYDVNGNLINTFSIAGVSGLGDLAFDGTYEYGGNGGSIIYQMSFQNETLVGTINAPITVRYIAYDADNDAFWIGNWSENPMLITRSGVVLATIYIPLTTISGFAYDGESPGGPFLWLFGSDAPDSLMISQIHIPSGRLTNVTHNVLSDIGIGQQNAGSGGLFFTDQFVQNTCSLGGILIGNPTKLFLYEIYNAVPVELISFIGDVYENKVVLNWTTSTETNNKGFEIQRQLVSRQLPVCNKWEKIGFADGYGTTTEPKSYSFIDKNLTAGTYNYRLKQIDFDGTFNYSQDVEVDVIVPGEFSLSQNFPNPFNPTTTIKYSLMNDGMVTLQVYNILGKKVLTLVNESKKAGDYSIKLNGSNLPSGVYLYRIQSGDFIAGRKMILLK
jgi:Secretion system C-terminal sorting domain